MTQRQSVLETWLDTWSSQRIRSVATAVDGPIGVVSLLVVCTAATFIAIVACAAVAPLWTTAVGWVVGATTGFGYAYCCSATSDALRRALWRKNPIEAALGTLLQSVGVALTAAGARPERPNAFAVGLQRQLRSIFQQRGAQPSTIPSGAKPIRKLGP